MDTRLLDFIKYDCFRAELGVDHPETIKERNRLALENHGLVRKVAHYYAGRSAVPYEDLEQIAFFGLIKAIERFDPFMGNQFSSLATSFIKGEILHYFRDKAPVVSGTRGLSDAERKLATCFSLDYRIASDSENDQLSLGDSIPAPCTTDEDSLLAQDLVRDLPPKYRRVIEGAYFHGQTSREMSHRFGLCRNTIHGQKARGLALMRKNHSL
jgi:RNA polymerase sigma factor (sigma-70 family)